MSAFKYSSIAIILFLLGSVARAQDFKQLQHDIDPYALWVTYDQDGVQIDTVITRIGFMRFDTKHCPLFIKDSDFSIRRSSIHGIGLFPNASRVFHTGDTVAMIFGKRLKNVPFNQGYVESRLGSYVNDSNNPTCTLGTDVAGNIFLIANREISHTIEITASYQALISMFPNDKTVEQLIKYW